MERQRITRLKEKVSSLTTVIGKLKQKSLISTECVKMLRDSFNGVAAQLLSRVHEKSNQATFQKILRLLRSPYISTQQKYTNVCEHFNLALPHPNTIHTWYRSVC